MTPRQRYAARRAGEVLVAFGIDALPIEPQDIIARQKLLFDTRDDFPPEIFGAFFRAGNSFGILVSERCFGEGHRRFTIAHELGHYCLDDHVQRLLPGATELAPSLGGHYRGRKDPFEVEADIFASHLLMPDALVRPIVRTHAPGMATIEAIAGTCHTSLLSAAIRYTELTGEPIAVLVSVRGTIEWTARSEALWAHGWARPRLRDEWAPRGSATKRLATDPARLANAERDSESLLACEWFPDAPASITLAEEAAGLGGYERVLTVLHLSDLPDADEPTEDMENDDPPDWRDALRPYRLG